MMHSDSERIKKIILTWEQLKKVIEEQNITRERLLKDLTIQWTVTTPLYNIGEQVSNLSKEFKDAHPDIIWNVVSGLRHRLVHDYDGINWEIIANVVFGEMDVFVEQIKKI